MVVSAGGFTAPHQDMNGVGGIIQCVSRYKAFLLPYNAGLPIICIWFNGIGEDEAEVGWEYQYYPLYSFGAFVLPPGQTL